MTAGMGELIRRKIYKRNRVIHHDCESNTNIFNHEQVLQAIIFYLLLINKFLKSPRYEAMRSDKEGHNSVYLALV